MEKAGIPILGTQVADLDRAEDRDLFEKALKDLGIPQPPGQTATNEEEAIEAARKVDSCACTAILCFGWSRDGNC